MNRKEIIIWCSICVIVGSAMIYTFYYEAEYTITGRVINIQDVDGDLCLHILDENNNTQEFTCASYTLGTPLWQIDGKNVSICWRQTLAGHRPYQSFRILDPLYGKGWTENIEPELKPDIIIHSGIISEYYCPICDTWYRSWSYTPVENVGWYYIFPCGHIYKMEDAIGR